MTNPSLEQKALAACPFNCGRGNPVLSSWLIGTARELLCAVDQYGHAVRCQCGAQGPESGSAELAIEAWNTREAAARIEGHRNSLLKLESYCYGLEQKAAVKRPEEVVELFASSLSNTGGGGD